MLDTRRAILSSYFVFQNLHSLVFWMLLFSGCHLVVKTHFLVPHPARLSERLAFVFPPLLLTVSAETVWTNIWSGPKNNQSVCWRRLPCCIQINNTQTELLLSGGRRSEDVSSSERQSEKQQTFYSLSENVGEY